MCAAKRQAKRRAKHKAKRKAKGHPRYSAECGPKHDQWPIGQARANQSKQHGENQTRA